MIRAFIVCWFSSFFLLGCQWLPDYRNARIPDAIQETIAIDLYSVMRSEVDPQTMPILLKPTSAGERALERQLRLGGYQVHVDGDFGATRLVIYHDDAENIYIGTLNVGAARRMTRQYRDDVDGLTTVGVTMIGE